MDDEPLSFLALAIAIVLAGERMFVQAGERYHG